MYTVLSEERSESESQTKRVRKAGLILAATLAACALGSAVYTHSTIEVSTLDESPVQLTFYSAKKPLWKRLKICGKQGMDIASADNAVIIERMKEMSGGVAFAAGYRAYGQTNDKSLWRFTRAIGEEGIANWQVGFPVISGNENNEEANTIQQCAEVDSNGQFTNVNCFKHEMPFFCTNYPSSNGFFRQVKALRLQSNNQLDTPLLQFGSKNEFEMVFDLKIFEWESGNVFQIGNSALERTFGLWIDGPQKKLVFQQNSIGGPNRGCEVLSDNPAMREVGRLMRLIVQSKPGDFKVRISGDVACTAPITLNPPQTGQKVWLSNPWDTAADARIRNMRFQMLA